MNKLLFLTILLFPSVVFSQEMQQRKIVLENQSEAKDSYFKLPPFEDELEAPINSLRYTRGIRFTIEPSFGEQITYEIFYNNFGEIPVDKKEKASEFFDLENAIVRKYKISDESKKDIEKYKQDYNQTQKACFNGHPDFDSLTYDEKVAFNGEYNQAIDKLIAPNKLTISVTETSIKGLLSKIYELENNSWSLFYNLNHKDGLDGTNYIIEIVSKNNISYKYRIWSPEKDTKEGKMVADILQLVNSL